jgi:hypothetical protein
MDQLAHINWVAVLIATVLGFGIGAIWFNPNVFGNSWMADLGKRREDFKNGPAKSMGLTFVTTLITAIGVAWLIRLLGAYSLMGGIKVGLLVGVAFVATSYYSDGLFEERKTRLIGITAAHRVLMLVIMGAILGKWGR